MLAQFRFDIKLERVVVEFILTPLKPEIGSSIFVDIGEKYY